MRDMLSCAMGFRSLLLAAAMPFATAQAGDPVEAELSVPAAETHVIGDPIPLFWRFRNTTAEPLAFMWEGCCRLNGRLTVTAVGKTVTMVPPGQALAHMFAKAERLEPGVGRDFDTFLSDWTRLRETGVYELRGRYTGVLPDQHPQVPRGLRLWREAAVTPPLQVALTSVTDYLGQRPDRIRRRGLAPTLAGPSALPPLETATFRLQIQNTGAAEQVFKWPEAVELWILDASGQRVRGASTSLEGSLEDIRIAAGTALERAVTVKPDMLEGEPFGDYQLFVDVRSGGEGLPRVPSNALPLAWRLTPEQVRALVEQAATGPAVGLRNAPLKLLRIYLGELRGILDAMESAQLTSPGASLLTQLRRAACLKRMAPKPGRVDLPLLIRPDGTWIVSGAWLPDCPDLGNADALQALRSVLAVRRHLGWEVGVELQPALETRLRHIAAVTGMLRSVQDELAGLPRLQAVVEGFTNQVQFPTVLPPANLLVRLAIEDGSVAIRAARRLADPQQPGLPVAFTAEEIPTLSLEPVKDSAALEALLADGRLTSPRVVILADAGLTWSQALAALGCLTKHVPTLHLVVRDL